MMGNSKAPRLRRITPTVCGQCSRDQLMSHGQHRPSSGSPLDHRTFCWWKLLPPESQFTVSQWEALAAEKMTPLFSLAERFSGLDKWQVYICIIFWVFFTSVLQELGATGTASLGIMQFLDFLYNSGCFSWLALLWSSKYSAGNQFLTLNLFSLFTPWMLAGLLTKHWLIQLIGSLVDECSCLVFRVI